MKTKKSSNHRNGHAASLEAAIAKADAAKKVVQAAREHFKMLKAEYKQARKAFKQAKKSSRRARKEAKIAAELLKSKANVNKHQAVKTAPKRRVTVAKTQNARTTIPTPALELPSQDVQTSSEATLTQ